MNVNKDELTDLMKKYNDSIKTAGSRFERLFAIAMYDDKHIDPHGADFYAQECVYWLSVARKSVGLIARLSKLPIANIENLTTTRNVRNEQ